MVSGVSSDERDLEMKGGSKLRLFLFFNFVNRWRLTNNQISGGHLLCYANSSVLDGQG